MTKVLTIMRGLPGAGKSFALASKVQAGRRPFIVSADHYFMQDGVYCFDPAKLGQAHSACQQKCVNAMVVEEPWIVVDNTNTRHWEYALYTTLARAFGYTVEVVDLFDGGCIDDELAARNRHGVPMEKIAGMRASYER